MSFIPLVLVLALTAQNVTRNPQCQTSVVKAHNPANGNYTILARNESVTGWISVVDEHISRRNDLHIRVMRAGHSLIGGMYAETGDSIFGSFYIPEGKKPIEVQSYTGEQWTMGEVVDDYCDTSIDNMTNDSVSTPKNTAVRLIKNREKDHQETVLQM